MTETAPLGLRSRRTPGAIRRVSTTTSIYFRRSRCRYSDALDLDLAGDFASCGLGLRQAEKTGVLTCGLAPAGAGSTRVPLTQHPTCCLRCWPPTPRTARSFVLDHGPAS